MKKKVIITVFVILLVALISWGRVPILEALPEGSWTELDSVVWYIPEGDVAIAPEELKEALDGVSVWRYIDYYEESTAPAYLFTIQIDNSRWFLQVSKSGCITVKPLENADNVEDRFFIDDGSLYRLLVERFGDAGLGTLEED